MTAPTERAGCRDTGAQAEPPAPTRGRAHRTPLVTSTAAGNREAIEAIEAIEGFSARGPRRARLRWRRGGQI